MSRASVWIIESRLRPFRKWEIDDGEPLSYSASDAKALAAGLTEQFSALDFRAVRYVRAPMKKAKRK